MNFFPFQFVCYESTLIGERGNDSDLLIWIPPHIIDDLINLAGASILDDRICFLHIYELLGSGIVILTLNGEFAVIVFPVVEADNLGMTAIMVMEQYFIVRIDEKQRYSFNEDKTLIRANQGRSIPVDVELKECTPPAVLYHGTGEKYVASIDAQGLIPKTRLYVHLSSDMDTARNVGSRHGKPVIYEVDCSSMISDGLIAAS